MPRKNGRLSTDEDRVDRPSSSNHRLHTVPASNATGLLLIGQPGLSGLLILPDLSFFRTNRYNLPKVKSMVFDSPPRIDIIFSRRLLQSQENRVKAAMEEMPSESNCHLRL